VKERRRVAKKKMEETEESSDAESLEDGIRSEVHKGMEKLATGNLYSSQFSFFLPSATGFQVENEEKANSDEGVDADGDLVLPRKPKRKEG
jgi:hypothetical protein